MLRSMVRYSLQLMFKRSVVELKGGCAGRVREWGFGNAESLLKLELSSQFPRETRIVAD